jgi:hypothetical protein
MGHHQSTRYTSHRAPRARTPAQQTQANPNPNPNGITHTGREREHKGRPAIRLHCGDIHQRHPRDPHNPIASICKHHSLPWLDSGTIGSTGTA